MPYTPTEWKTGDVVSSERLNKMESGIAGAKLFKVVITSRVVDDNGDALPQPLTVDKNAFEIKAAFDAGMLPVLVPADDEETQSYFANANVFYPKYFFEEETDEYVYAQVKFSSQTPSYDDSTGQVDYVVFETITIDTEGDTLEEVATTVEYGSGDLNLLGNQS